MLWVVLQRAMRFYSVPVATAASVLGAGLAVFALVRWLVIPLVRLPGRDQFVAMVERRYPEHKNLIVNAYQSGSHEPEGQTARRPISSRPWSRALPSASTSICAAGAIRPPIDPSCGRAGPRWWRWRSWP